MIDSVEIMERIKVIKPLSHAAHQVLGVMGRRDREPQEICTIIENDSALTAAVLRFVNSAQFNLRRELLTVKDAVAYLGETRVIAIALAAAGKSFFNAELRGYHGSRGDLGRHCLFAAIASRELAHFTFGAVDPGVAFTAGLLHDLGKATISDFLEGKTDDILAELDYGEGIDFIAAERRHLGTTHCEVGYELANHWEIPYPLTIGIRHHHTPRDAEPCDQSMAFVIHVADMLAMANGICSKADCLNYAVDRTYTELMMIDAEQLAKVTKKVKKEWQIAAGLMFNEPADGS